MSAKLFAANFLFACYIYFSFVAVLVPSRAHLFSRSLFGDKKLFTAGLIFCCTLSWFYVFHTYLLNSMLTNSESNLIYVSIGTLLFYSAAVISGIVGSQISEKMDRRRFSCFWVTLGFLSTISLIFLQGSEVSLLLSILLGTSFGLGFPTCQALLTESTEIESRGRIAGIVIMIAFIIPILILILTPLLKLVGTAIVCSALNATCLLALLITPIEREKGPRKSWAHILTSKSFASYAIPWFIFNVANGILSFGKLPPEIDAGSIGTAIEFIAAIFTAVTAGFLADRNGRKQPMFAGLVVLGIAYMFFGIVTSSESYLVYLIVEGIAWGLIAVVYMQVILGDISAASGSKERFYALGGIMIPVLTRTAFSVGQELSGLTVPANSLAAMLGIMTFLSLLPLLRAPETLPEKLVRARELREHIKKVEKIVNKSEKPN